MKTLLIFGILLLECICSLNVIAQKKVLIFSKNASYAYRHESIEAAKKAIKIACESHGIMADTTENADFFVDETLQKYHAIILLSANQDVLNARQEKAFQRFVRAGGGVIGIHAATGMERNWHWFKQMLGASFDWHPVQQNASVKAKVKKHLATKELPKNWNRKDEWYLFKEINPNIKVLTVLDTTTFKAQRHTQNYPSSWYNEFENATIFYTAIGHNIEDYADENVLGHIMGGIEFVLKKTKNLDYSKNDAFKLMPAQIITLDPGHFHAALVQKFHVENVLHQVQIYAPETSDVQEHLKRISSYNSRSEKPTHWDIKSYLGSDYLEKMLAEKKGNLVVLAGNNLKKTEYIYKSIASGLNVLADKPMCIDTKGFELLKKAFELAKQNKVLLYDIMTERSEITTLLQKELMQNKILFGQLTKGSIESPAVIKESTHHFYKQVSGAALKRPSWFFDVKQEGEGIVDVTTHLVDLVQWECFPEIPLAYKDVEVLKASKWSTKLSKAQFSTITQEQEYPDYLLKNVDSENNLNVLSNGEFDYTLKNVHAKVKVIWNYETKIGGDTHYSIVKGTRADLEIKQGEKENFITQLYINPKVEISESEVKSEIEKLAKKYPGLTVSKDGGVFKVGIPEKYRTGHEAHFAEVLERFMEYYQVNNLPDWEVSNILLKYFTTIQAFEKSN
jgi:type 1 glutamine amidotransferase/predicted dehydrogenase